MKEHIVNRLRIFLAVICAAVMLMVPPFSMADDVAVERAALVRLIHELEQLEAQIQKAESAAVSTQRVHFQYLWLRADLNKVQAGIREYLDTAPSTLNTPRAIPPLAGDYIR